MAHPKGTLSNNAALSNDTTEHTGIVQTTHGPVRGFVDNGMQKYLGIPYAAPPVSDLRWRLPIAPRAWKDTLNAVAFGPICAQNTVCFPGFGTDSSTEDCLYLNVFTPNAYKLNNEQKLPVMVFIHGGGFASGASNDYNPTSLVNQGHVVFVSLNYRVTIFGFFSHPAINAEDHPSGNYGIMDQQLALMWVQQNIENFGGDASNVTVFGESAGGASVLAHIAAPSSRNLFHKAIIQSGGSPPTMPFPTIEKLEAQGTALATAAGCTEQTAENLRQLSTEDLMVADALDEGAFALGKFPFGLMEDGQIVPNNLRDVFSRGDFNGGIPMIVGVNRDEFTWFQAMMELRSGKVVSAEAYPQTVASTIDLLNKLHLNGVTVPPHAIPQVLQMYPVDAYGGHASNALAAVVGDAGLISTAGRRTTRVLAKYAPAVYAYEFDVPDTPCPWPEVSFPYGSAHTLELPYIFPGFRGGSGKHTTSLMSEPQQRLAREMVRCWTTFAWLGTPNGDGSNDIVTKGTGSKEKGSSATSTDTEPNLTLNMKWDTYNAEADNVMLFQTSEPSKMIEGWGQRHNSDYWDAFY